MDLKTATNEIQVYTATKKLTLDIQTNIGCRGKDKEIFQANSIQKARRVVIPTSDKIELKSKTVTGQRRMLHIKFYSSGR